MAGPFALAWEYRAKDYLVRSWDPAVHLHGDLVFGLWFCLRLSDGGVVWERRHRRLDKMVGLSDGIIVATQEYDSIGPLTVGVYGLNAETGEMLWTNHGPGPLRWLRRALDFVPLLTNSGCDFPLAVRDRKVLCRSGRVLDVRTGDSVERDEAWAADALARASETPDERLMRPTRHGVVWQTVVKETGAVRWSLSHRSLEVWGFDSVERGLHLDTGHTVIVGDYLLIISADQPVWVPSKNESWRMEQNPTQRRMLVVDAATGEVLQELPLTQGGVRVCDFQASTDECALVRRGSNDLLCVRVVSPTAETIRKWDASNVGGQSP